MQSQNPIPIYSTKSGTIRNSTTTREEIKETKHITAQQGMKAIFY